MDLVLPPVLRFCPEEPMVGVVGAGVGSGVLLNIGGPFLGVVTLRTKRGGLVKA